MESSATQGCGPETGPSMSCLPLKGEEQGDIVSYFQRELPSGDQELVRLSNEYPPDALEGWSKCWSASGPVPEDFNFVECRCAPW